jgi:putative sterol carrier protein
VFSATWAAEWARRLNASEAYRTAAATWEGSVVLQMAPPGARDGPAVFLDLWHGACRQAREASPEDIAGARFVIRGDEPAWRAVLAGKTSPVMAVLTGRLRLVRGEIAALLPYAGAAKELLASAAELETIFPEA